MSNLGGPVLIYLLFALTGATSLILQTVWKRDFTLIFGADYQAASIVLAAFMGGLALGGVALGRLCDRIQRPLRLYGVLEISVALFALLLPFALRGVEAVYISIASQSEQISSMVLLLRAVFAFGLLIVPTFFMGGTLPILTRFLTRNLGLLPNRLSWLYGINTVGAFLGALAGGFLLLPLLGVRGAEMFAVAINLAVGIIAILLDRAPAASGAQEVAIDRPSISSTPSPAQPALQWPLAFVFWGTALCGFCALALEVFWTRALSIALGTTTYNFTLMLAAFLSGIGLGGLLYGRLRISSERLPLAFAATLAMIAFFSLAACQAIPAIPQLSLQINQALYGHFSGVRPFTSLLASYAVMLIPALLFGLAFPMAADARARARLAIGASVGDSVGLNTVGAVAGALCAGFVIIPTIGLQRGMISVSTLLLVYAMFVAATCAPRRATRAACAIAALFALALPIALPAWDLHRLGVFRNNIGDAYLTREGRVDLEQGRGFSSLVFYREGRGATVSVTQSAQMRAILINGKTVATDSQQGLGLQLMMGHLPCLLHPDPREALVIGLGAGVTLGAVTHDPAVQDARLVEIEPAVVEGAEHFRYIHHDALRSPKLTVLIQDGRNYLRATRRQFDIITADPIHPWAAGSTYLFTREYYADALARLKPGGMMAQWTPLYELSLDNIRTLIATFADVFDHVQVWRIYHDAILIGSRDPIRIDPDALVDRLAQPDIAASLERIDIVDVETFLSLYVAEDKSLRELATGAAINTDNNLRLEFATPHNIGRDTSRENTDALRALRSPPPLIPPENWGPARFEAFQERLERRQGLEAALLALDRDISPEEDEAACDCNQGFIDALVELMGDYDLESHPRAQRLLYREELRCGLAAVSDNDIDAAMERFRHAIDLFPHEGQAYNQLSVLVARQGDLDEALRLAALAVEKSPRSADAWINLGALREARSEFSEAERCYQQAMATRPGYWFANEQLGRLHLRLGRPDRAIPRFEAALDEHPLSVSGWLGLGAAWLNANQPRSAIFAYEEALRLNPDASGIYPILITASRMAGDERLAQRYERGAGLR